MKRTAMRKAAGALALSLAAQVGAASAAHASPADAVLAWAAEGASRKAGQVNWDLSWGDVYRDGRTLRSAPSIQREFLNLSDMLVRLSLAAYPDDPDEAGSTDAQVYKEFGLERVAYVNPTVGTAMVSPEAIIARSRATPTSPQSVIVAVRGSDKLTDWMLDFAALAQRDGNANYHLGFQQYAGELMQGVETALEPYCNDGQTRIWLTGHSLGGASAQILALWLAQSGCDVQGVMSFGAPTPGNQEFYAQYRSVDGGRLFHNTHRWVHQHDVVPCVPAGSVWKDVGIRHYIWGGALAAAFNEPYGIYVTGATYGDPPRVPNCEEESDNLVEAIDNYVDKGVEWINDAACPNNKGLRIFLGVLTGGASEATCLSAEIDKRLMDVSEQLTYDFIHGLDGGLSLLAHMMGKGYTPALHKAGRGELLPTGTPPPNTSPPVRQADGCFSGYYCQEFDIASNECILCVEDSVRPR